MSQVNYPKLPKDVYDILLNFDYSEYFKKIEEEKKEVEKKQDKKKNNQYNNNNYYKSGSNVNLYSNISNSYSWYSTSIGLP